VIRVGVVASTLALRVGLRGLLDHSASVQVITEAATLSELDPIPREVDVLVIALDDPFSLEYDHMQGVMENAAVLALTADEIESAQSLPRQSNYAWGVLPMDSTANELLAAISALKEGLIVGSPHLMKSMFSPPIESERISSEKHPERLIEPLTQRETQVLQLLAQGLANKQIALSLKISEHTVKFHVSSIYAKLGATNRTEAVRLGVRHGLVVL
jgi:DNA-binding NarL/FixJ family response regulator